MTKQNEKLSIITDNGEKVLAQTPVIISASRSTDIPAFYSDWFFYRLKRGYLKWKNPFNGIPLFVSFAKTRLIVFWTKNPEPILKHLSYLDDKNINYYFQYTLNDYEEEKLEPNLPDLKNRIETFIKLSLKIGKEKLLWRFDPLILTDKITINDLISKIEFVGDQIAPYTNKLIFSFADIDNYKKVQNNLKSANINYNDFDNIKMIEFATKLSILNKKWNLEIATCAEKIDLTKYNISPNKCIDDDLMKKLFYDDSDLMRFLGFEKNIFEELVPISKRIKKMKDKGQRKDCNCIASKDIGQYNTCIHDCVYCYANKLKTVAHTNFKKHSKHPLNETISNG